MTDGTAKTNNKSQLKKFRFFVSEKYAAVKPTIVVIIAPENASKIESLKVDFSKSKA